MKSLCEIEEMVSYHYGKEGTSKRVQCENEVKAYREMIEKVSARLHIDKVENEIQYEWAINRVEELLPLVNDETLLCEENSVELEILSIMVSNYSDKHYSIFDL